MSASVDTGTHTENDKNKVENTGNDRDYQQYDGGTYTQDKSNC